jgi:prepilin-type N-terminal cleavage/methylation domain-containing protein
MQSARRQLHVATRPRSGFTLVELLVVISIIAILIAILLPVVGKIRKQVYATNTKAGIAQLEAAILSYFNDFKAYPGPIPNTQLRGAGNNNITTPALIGAKITMAENLYLGLMGGLEPDPAAPGTFIYAAARAGFGPRSLGPTPKKYNAYIENNYITQRVVAGATSGDFEDDIANCDDSEVPEFLDRFPDALPLLYLRARPGMTGVVSPLPSPTDQYDQTQVTPYTGAAPTGGGYIGMGKENDGHWTAPFPRHGFNTLPNPLATIASEYPLNIYTALRHPTVTAGTPTAPLPTARQRDRFIFISAGVDRVYGTRDDITNFGDY